MPDDRVLLWLGLISLIIFFVSLLSLPWLVAKIPADYFAHDRRIATPWKDAHPAVRILLLILKNLLGLVLVIGGLLMLFLPGQGLLTLAMGLVLMDYPGKYTLERWVVSIPLILKGLNWLRRKRHVSPLIVGSSKHQ